LVLPPPPPPPQPEINKARKHTRKRFLKIMGNLTETEKEKKKIEYLVLRNV
jgi:hypothetical protein